DVNAALSLLQRTSISGKTVLPMGSSIYNRSNVTVILTSDSSELIANTTSDEYGDYSFNDVPNGNYAIVALQHVYSSSSSTWKWYTNTTEIVIENGEPLSDFDLRVSSKDTETDVNAALSLLQRTSISGKTVLPMGSSIYNRSNVTVLLLEEMEIQSPEVFTNSPHLNIAIVTGYASHTISLNEARDIINNDPEKNITFHYYLSESVNEHGADLSDMDVIYVQMLSSTTALNLMDTVNEAIENGAVVIDDNTALNESIPSNIDPDSFKEVLQVYWANGAYDASNIENLVYKIAYDCYGRKDLTVESPKELPDSAIYHPDMERHLTENLTTYLEWYQGRTNSSHAYDPALPTVGITFYKSYYPLNIEPVDALIREFESRGVNVIATYGSDNQPCGDYFKNDNETLVDAIATTTYFGNKFDAEELNVPVMNWVINNYMNLSEWENSSHPLPSNKMLKIDLPELEGSIDPIIVATSEINPDTQATEYRSIDYQLEWFVDRTIAQTNLADKPEEEKKIAIIYYSHGGGKDSIGASYLNVASSLCNMLVEMEKAGYNVNTTHIPNQTALIDTMLTQGINIGTWAPGELEKLVETGNVVLLPVETYQQWFSELPEEKQQEVTDMWGPVPGEIMVYENDTGQYLVIPKIDAGDGVMLTPQPTRGWLQDNDVLYHDKDLPPHHQYIAFYLWLQKDDGYGADAIVHFGRHGTQEWLPGKQFGLSRYDWPSLMTGHLPVVYPYVMDGLGEGNQAKRRGNAVIIDHLVPPIIAAGSYGDHANLSDAIINYEMAVYEPQKEFHKAEIINLTKKLNLDEQLDMNLIENETTFEDEFLEELEHLLDDLKTTSMPYGLHILGTAMQGDELTGMINSMLGRNFADEVSKYNSSENAQLLLLDLVLNQGMNRTAAQQEVLGTTSLTIDHYLEDAQLYTASIQESENEINQTLRALDGQFIAANLGGDPVGKPDTLPTGRNFYAFDQRKVPTVAAWELGKLMADQMLEAHKEKHDGEYPRKVAYVLWAGETTRHEGVMEAQIFYLLGVEPVWDNGRVVDVKPIENLDRPRIDVVIQISGLYRDMFPDKVRLIDKAVQVSYEQDEPPINYVKQNSDLIRDALMNETPSLSESDAHNLSLLRIFGSADGAYGTGLPNAIEASDTWNNTDKLAELFLSRMSHAYGQNVWGTDVDSLYSMNLIDVEVTAHSRSSNLYGMFDNDDFVQYLGGLNLLIEYLSGNAPDSYVINLESPGSEEVQTLESYAFTELYSRYFNPTWIEGMMAHGYAGASEMSDFFEVLWMWEATNPELITDAMWEQAYQTYINDPEVSDWLKETSPYHYQSMTGRLLETTRKEGWDAPDEIVQHLVKEYVESVVENGFTCCHHTCGNPLLDEYVQGIMSVPGVVDQETAEEYQRLRQELTGTTQSNGDTQSSTTSSKSSSSGGTGEAQIVSSGTENQTYASPGGYGESLQEPLPQESSSYVEGYEMNKESQQPEKSSSMAFSGADIIGTILVLMAVGVMYAGYRRRGI
ncbi:cobaltochelatase CobN, partial [Methanohalophilus levihalophilus]|uniref:cobaltochelatase subunit CobN n=1 Tax=Methanohalophilus levihalophilus TaxID=1431282 RepID=UPI002477D832